MPVFYVENVDTNGTTTPYVPNGIDDLSFDLQAYPVGVSDYGNGFINSYLVSRLKGDVTAIPTVSMVLLESAPNPATSTNYTSLNSIAAKTLGGTPIYVQLAEFDGNISNRVIQSGDNFFWRFANPRFTELETLSGDPVTHYALVAAGGTLSGSELVIGGDALNPVLTPDGVKSSIIRLSTGIAVGI
jgi:hypothetical protein